MDYAINCTDYNDSQQYCYNEVIRGSTALNWSTTVI